MTSLGGGSHIGAVFSCADILAVLYGGILRVDARAPEDAARDRFVLSKGHAGAGLYAALAERGFFPVEMLLTHYQDGSDLCGHVSHALPGVDVSTGSLGHGLSVAAGMAYAGKLKGVPEDGAAVGYPLPDGRGSEIHRFVGEPEDGDADKYPLPDGRGSVGRGAVGCGHRVFCLLSDGECDEGSTWEAALFAAHHGLSNLVAIVDYNRIQGIAPVSEVVELEPFADKWRAFGWAVREVDGHDHEGLRAVLSAVPFASGRPSCLIAHSTKGKGVSFMENTVLWHYRIPRGAEFDAAMAELEAQG